MQSPQNPSQNADPFSDQSKLPSILSINHKNPYGQLGQREIPFTRFPSAHQSSLLHPLLSSNP